MSNIGTDEFAAPATATGIKWDDFKGSLLLIDVSSVETAIKTAFGESDAVRANVTIVDGRSAGETYNDTLIFPKVLVSQLRPNVGKKVLGRLGQGQAKSGQSAPWKLDDATDADRATAREFIAKGKTASPPF